MAHAERPDAWARLAQSARLCAPQEFTVWGHPTTELDRTGQTFRLRRVMQAVSPPPASAAETARRRSIAFINWAHAIDHYVMLILATAVIDLASVYQRSYAD